jgi:hypothetical protein
MTPAKKSRSSSFSTPRLTRSTRLILSAVGLAGLIAGTFAVFLTDNKFGTLTLLIIGTILMVAGTTGIIPVVRVGDKELSYDRDHAIIYAEATQKTTEETLSNPDIALDTRRSISDLIVEFNESFMEQGGVVPEVSQRLALQAYKISVVAALKRCLPEAQIVEASGDLQPTDFIARVHDSELHIVVAMALKTTSSPMPSGIVSALIETARRVPLLLTVTNRPPVGPVYERVEGRRFQPRSLPYNLEIATWKGPDDDRSLTESARRLLDTEH